MSEMQVQRNQAYTSLIHKVEDDLEKIRLVHQSHIKGKMEGDKEHSVTLHSSADAAILPTIVGIAFFMTALYEFTNAHASLLSVAGGAILSHLLNKSFAKKKINELKNVHALTRATQDLFFDAIKEKDTKKIKMMVDTGNIQDEKSRSLYLGIAQAYKADKKAGTDKEQKLLFEALSHFHRAGYAIPQECIAPKIEPQLQIANDITQDEVNEDADVAVEVDNITYDAELEEVEESDDEDVKVDANDVELEDVELEDVGNEANDVSNLNVDETEVEEIAEAPATIETEEQPETTQEPEVESVTDEKPSKIPAAMQKQLDAISAPQQDVEAPVR